MNTALKYHLRQLFNHWHHLTFRFRMELLLLGGLFIIVFSEKLTDLFKDIRDQIHTAPSDLAAFILILLLLFTGVITPFTLKLRLPMLNNIKTLRKFPLGPVDVFFVLILSQLRFQSAVLYFAVPLLIALSFSGGPHFAMLVMFLYIIWLINFNLTAYWRLFSHKGSSLYYLTYFILLSFFFIIYGLLFVLGSGDALYLCVLPFLSIIPLALFWSRKWDHWVDLTRPPDRTQHRRVPDLKYRDLPRIFTGPVWPLICRELLPLLRNPRFLFVNLSLLLLLVLGLLIAVREDTPEFANSGPLIIALAVWFHFGLYFNRRYVRPESRHFIRTLPVPFRVLWSSRFLTAFIFLIPVLGIHIFFQAAAGVPGSLIPYSSLGLLTFGIVTLYLVTMIRILFFESPGKAGYAFHFLILFSVVMIYYFYLVGPVVITGLLIYLGYLTRRKYIL